jgi:hypothetical protein
MPRKGSNRIAKTREVVASLPRIGASIQFSKTFRFVADAAVNQAIDFTCVRELIGMGYHSALPANGIYRLIDAFRIKRVELFAIGAIGTSQTVALDWASSNTGRSTRVSDTSLGMAPAHVSTVPPANTASAFWQNTNGSVALFTLAVPSGAVVDLTLDIVLVDTAGAFITSTNTVTDGSFYIKPLDTVMNSYQGHLVPSSYANVIMI